MTGWKNPHKHAARLEVEAARAERNGDTAAAEAKRADAAAARGREQTRRTAKDARKARRAAAAEQANKGKGPARKDVSPADRAKAVLDQANKIGHAGVAGRIAADPTAPTTPARATGRP